MSETDIRCDFCGNTYSRKLAACESCNFPNPEKSQSSSGTAPSKRTLLVVFGGLLGTVLLVFGLLALSSGSDSADSETESVNDPRGGTPSQQWESTVSGAVADQAAAGDRVVLLTEGSVTALGPDGSESWSTDIASSAQLMFANDSLVVVETDEALIGLEVSDGSQRWSLDGLTFVAATAQGALIRDGNEGLGLVDAEGGVVWSIEAADQVAVSDELVFVRTGRTLTAYTVDRGGKRWETQTPFTSSDPEKVSMAASNKIVAIAGNKEAIGYDNEDGTKAWSEPAAGNQLTAIDLSDELIALQLGSERIGLYDVVGQTQNFARASEEDLAPVELEVESVGYAALPQQRALIDASGVVIREIPEGQAFPDASGFFVAGVDEITHFTIGQERPDYTLPGGADARVVSTTGGPVVIDGDNVTAYR